MVGHPRIRVCHIVSGDTWGGLEVTVLNLLQCQATRLDLEPSLVILNEGRFASRAKEIGIRVLVVSESDKSIARLVHAVDKALAELAPSIVHAHRYKEHFLSYLLAWRHRAKCVSTIHGYEPPGSSLGAVKFLAWDCLNYVLARMNCASFTAVASELSERYRVPPKQCTIIPNGIPLPIEDRNMDKIRLKDRSSIPVVGWVGRMVPVKGLTTLLKAIALMPSLGAPQLPRVLLIGDGPERSALEELSKKLGLREVIQFLGFVPEPRLLLSQIDIFVLPSLHEGIPLALLEALAAGVPAVVSAVGGIPAIVGDTGAAILVNSSSPEEWAKMLIEVSSSPEKSQEMGMRGRRLVRERFSIDLMTDRYSSVYTAALP